MENGQYRILDPRPRGEIIDHADTIESARAIAAAWITENESDVEILHLENGLFGFDYYRVEVIEA